MKLYKVTRISKKVNRDRSVSEVREVIGENLSFSAAKEMRRKERYLEITLQTEKGKSAENSE